MVTQWELLGAWLGQISPFTKWSGRLMQGSSKGSVSQAIATFICMDFFLKQIRYCESLSSHSYTGKLSVGYLPTAWWHKGTPWSSVKSSNRHHCTKWLPLARAQEAGDSSRERWSDSLNFSVPILTQTLAISSLFLLFSTGLSDQLSLSLPLPWSLLPAHTSYSALSAPKKHHHHL